ncbi:hypothetical protein CPB84DRAFT_1799869 [Gymnopilus junonius]|uniref:Uncharacterized protein n=1 Tax=Gymnopilus junonius TaxID=109634 RepID=A0A9P5N8E3_GYMJU|nr:hypothetical protein CPB84DRAFT_1799869 [Gymnopilus junonius]
MFSTGLLPIFLLFSSAIGIGSCAPIRECSFPSLVERYDDLSNLLVTREFGVADPAIYAQRELDELALLDERDLVDLLNEFSKRGNTIATIGSQVIKSVSAAEKKSADKIRASEKAARNAAASSKGSKGSTVVKSSSGSASKPRR